MAGLASTDARIIKNSRTVENTPSSGKGSSPRGLRAGGRLRGPSPSAPHSCVDRVEEKRGEERDLGSVLRNDGKLLSEA